MSCGLLLYNSYSDRPTRTLYETANVVWGLEHVGIVRADVNPSLDAAGNASCVSRPVQSPRVPAPWTTWAAFTSGRGARVGVARV